MKSSVLKFAAVFIIALAQFTAASDKEKKSINSLLYGLEYGNKGIKVSCALTIAEYRYTEAVGTLVKILKKEEDEEVQLAVVLALYNIRSEKAVAALREASEKSSSASVKNTASLLYLDLLRTQSIAMN